MENRVSRVTFGTARGVEGFYVSVRVNRPPVLHVTSWLPRPGPLKSTTIKTSTMNKFLAVLVASMFAAGAYAADAPKAEAKPAASAPAASAAPAKKSHAKAAKAKPASAPASAAK